MQSVAVTVVALLGAVVVTARVPTLALFQTSLAGLLACISRVDSEKSGAGFVMGGSAGNPLGLDGVSYHGYWDIEEEKLTTRAS